MLPDLYISLYNNVKSLIAKVKYIAITTDIWTSEDNRSYITVTAHFICNKQQLPTTAVGILLQSKLLTTVEKRFSLARNKIAAIRFRKNFYVLQQHLCQQRGFFLRLVKFAMAEGIACPQNI
ncbi:hypothetical protein QE152_g4796 [Popillia japonica]|uniref:Transposase n=1 Tax=Popillia japonica TaxID=7064 RepID=A0AAW1MZ99_POPJA